MFFRMARPAQDSRNMNSIWVFEKNDVAARKQAFTGGPHVPGINPKSGLIKPKSGD